jgi:DNA replication and repair protein RecF
LRATVAAVPVSDETAADVPGRTASQVLVDLELRDFRCFEHLHLQPATEGITVLTGPNGSGKTSLLEAVGYLALLRSFRTAQREALVRGGADRAFLRGSLVDSERQLLIEAEIARAGRSRALLNRQPVHSRKALAEAVSVSVFAPEDLELLQGGPAARRELLDGAAVALHPAVTASQEQFERAVRQRNAALRQAGGQESTEIGHTLDVWDDRLAASGSEVRTARETLLGGLRPLVEKAYQRLTAGSETADVDVALAYRGSWEGSLLEALRDSRRADLRRGSTGVGPHHDELEIRLAGRDARQQASQGEQRCLALALRLGVHELVTQRRGVAPLLMLDDVFSELDPQRSRALVGAVPSGQTLLTTASPVPPDLEVSKVVDVVRSRSTGAGGAEHARA